MDYFEIIKESVEFIERNLENDLQPKDIAEHIGFSYYHFHRIFKAMLGNSVMEYVRKRRLTCAAHRLISSNERIIDTAVNYHFQSHENFTKAFKKMFGINPAECRRENYNLTFFEMPEVSVNRLREISGNITMKPQIVTRGSFKLAGMRCQSELKNNIIPEFFTKFQASSKEIKNQVNENAFYLLCECLCFNSPDSVSETKFVGFMSREVSEINNLPAGITSKTLPAQKYAVFMHTGEAGKLSLTYDYIYKTWLPNSNYELATLEDFEYYDGRFTGINDPDSKIEIFIPIK
ncbi:MAG: AraC family transcriptional regulator [Candidatus Wallbacteria bacterium]